MRNVILIPFYFLKNILETPVTPKPNQPFALNLKTYPNEQTIKESKLK